MCLISPRLNYLLTFELSVFNCICLFLSLTGGEEGRPPPGLVSVDSSRRRMSGPILNSVSSLKQKNLVTTDFAVNKDAMVSVSSAWFPFQYLDHFSSVTLTDYECNV